jgi:hypothetical protein
LKVPSSSARPDLGWPPDVALVRRYLEDLSTEVLSAASAIAPGPFIDPQSHGYGWAASRKRAIVNAVVPRLRDYWSHLPGFDEHTWTHVWWMYHQLVVLKEPLTTDAPSAPPRSDTSRPFLA